MNTRKFIISRDGKENTVEITDSNVVSDLKLEIESAVKDKIKLQVGADICEFGIKEAFQPSAVQKPSEVKVKEEAKEGEFTIKAPMRGIITKILVKLGDKIKKGDATILLEAMKMENRIESPSSGEVKRIITSVGAKVAPGDPLVIVR